MTSLSVVARRVGALVAAVAAATVVAVAPASAQNADLEGVGFDLGAPDAPVVVVEYADFACDACAQFARETWPTIRRDFVETGRVAWKIVPFELGFRTSDEGARAGYCAAEAGAFWEVHDHLYEEQERWFRERRPKDVMADLAAEVGLDRAWFRECLDDNPGRDRIEDANRAARKDRVRATPTFYINGFKVQGALPVEAFSELLVAAEEGREPGG